MATAKRAGKAKTTKARQTRRPKPAGAHSGGCLCGAIRFTARGKPNHIGNCHCTQCRKATGAAFATFAGFESKDVTFTKGKPRYFRSSAWAARGFCPKCGTSLVYKLTKDASKIWLAVGAMDKPERLAPKSHIFTTTMVKWLKFRDGLPRYKAFPAS
jgi:hypothetical protein